MAGHRRQAASVTMADHNQTRRKEVLGNDGLEL